MNQSKPPKKVHGYLLEVRILNEIKAIAQKEDRSMNDVANRLLDQAIRAYNGESVSLDAIWERLRSLTDRVSRLEDLASSRKTRSKR